QLAPTNTPGPSPTFTATPTIFGATAIPTQVFSGPTPLSAFLNATYTPTALYVNTPRSAVSVDQFRIAKQAYDNKDWDVFIENMLLIEPLEPDSVDIPYYIGEAYRFKGDATSAARYYRQAMNMNPAFGPAYLGLARVSLMSNPDFNPEKLFNQAIEYDPNLGEAYLERARWLIRRGDYADALPDLELADKIMPGSPEVYLAYANSYLGDGDKEKALEYAQKAYEADILNLPTYKLLGDLYIEKEDYANAAEALRLYTTYESQDATGFGKLGEAYYYLGEYQNAVLAIDAGEQLNRNGMKKYMIYRGLSHVELGNFNEAEGDLNIAVDDEPESFEARLGYAKALYGVSKFGSAFLQAESMRSLADTDEEKALELYWRAKIQEQRNDIRDAIKSWNDLLKLDESVMTPEMRQEAQEHLKTLVPPTNTPKGGAPTSTPVPVTKTPQTGTTPTVGKTPTKAPSATPTP
ncbi:MAG TPA: tetratricopeptide repeat protein, partial [Anaerolineales bacterium]|nr:tetratricopeptide repeat protein [Anaerolineales bacterium]